MVVMILGFGLFPVMLSRPSLSFARDKHRFSRLTADLRSTGSTGTRTTTLKVSRSWAILPLPCHDAGPDMDELSSEDFLLL